MASPNLWPLHNVPRMGQSPPNAPGSLQYAALGGVVSVHPNGDVSHSLTVSDVERLAKAGVVIKFEDIASQVTPDPMKQMQGYVDPALAQAIVNRLQMSHPDPSVNHSRPRFDLACSKYKDKVYVFASYWGEQLMGSGSVKTEPCILIDDMAVFPSDALMAKLIFLKEQAK